MSADLLFKKLQNEVNNFILTENNQKIQILILKLKEKFKILENKNDEQILMFYFVTINKKINLILKNKIIEKITYDYVVLEKSIDNNKNVLLISNNVSNEKFNFKSKKSGDELNNIIDKSKYKNFNEFYKNVIIKYNYIFVTLSSIPWKCDLFQRPQHIAQAMANQGVLSIFISIYGDVDKLNNEFEMINSNQNLWITSNFNEIFTIKKAYYSIYSTSYMDMYDKLNIIKKNNGKIVYEYIDHIDIKISGDKKNCVKLEKLKKYACKNSSLIVASAMILYDDIKNITDKPVSLIENGVSVEDFTNYNDKYKTDETYLDFISKFDIIIGYFGAIAPWLDYDMINKIIMLEKNIGFVFIGPDYLSSIHKLKKNDNLFYFPPIPYKFLPNYAKYFDICFIPFEKGEIAKTTSPLKLFEYFALQKPVITSSYMLECIKFEEVLHYNSLETLSDAINKAKKLCNDQNYKLKLLQLANDNSWNIRAQKFLDELKKI